MQQSGAEELESDAGGGAASKERGEAVDCGDAAHVLALSFNGTSSSKMVTRNVVGWEM